MYGFSLPAPTSQLLTMEQDSMALCWVKLEKVMLVILYLVNSKNCTSNKVKKSKVNST